MSSKHARGDVIYHRCGVDVPAVVKADVDKYGINVTQTAVAALRKAVEERKAGVVS